jgi:FkbM family methyltransferase
MVRSLPFFTKLYFVFVMVIRNIRWVVILLFAGGQRSWSVLDFKMYLTARKAGLDPMEKSIHKQLILDGAREQKSSEIMQKFIRPDDVILELGANIGYYVLLESKVLSDKGYIYAVEPAPENVELLKKNIHLNDVKNMEVFNLAISDKKGTARLYMGRACNLHSLINNGQDAQYVEVKTDTVDGFLGGKKPVTFLRMDIEGYETQVIEGMKKTLASPDIKRLFVEIHPHRVSLEKMQGLLRKLKDYGFETAYCVSHDKFQRSVLGQTRVEQPGLLDLAADKRLVEDKLGFELFLERI